MGQPIARRSLAQGLAQGFTFVACGMDNALLARAADALLANLREQLAGT